MMIHVDKKLNKSYIAYVSLAIFKSNQLVQPVEFQKWSYRLLTEFCHL